MDRRDVFWLTVSLAVAAIVGVWGEYYAEAAQTAWFASLKKPPLYPGEGLLRIGWCLALLCMAVAAWRIGAESSYDNPGPVRAALAVYALPLLLHVGWLYVFFFLQRFGWAALLLVLLWGGMGLTAWAFWKISRWAGGVMLAPLLWTSFQLYLGIGIAVAHSEFLGDVLRRLS